MNPTCLVEESLFRFETPEEVFHVGATMACTNQTTNMYSCWNHRGFSVPEELQARRLVYRPVPHRHPPYSTRVVSNPRHSVHTHQ